MIYWRLLDSKFCYINESPNLHVQGQRCLSSLHPRRAVPSQKTSLDSVNPEHITPDNLKYRGHTNAPITYKACTQSLHEFRRRR